VGKIFGLFKKLEKKRAKEKEGEEEREKERKEERAEEEEDELKKVAAIAAVIACNTAKPFIQKVIPTKKPLRAEKRIVSPWRMMVR
jgi:predicted histidine transporter YuiF (NhaC family)